MKIEIKDKQIKHSGADWMQRQDKFSGHSKLGEKVADILGQVYLGIYHIAGAVQSKKVDWKNEHIISVTIYGELATVDRPELTLLILCCNEAGVAVSISGAFKGYTKLAFTPSDQHIDLAQRSLEIAPQWLGKSAKDVAAPYMKRLSIWEYKDPYNVALSVSQKLDMPQLIDLVLIAHITKTRISIQGITFGVLQMQFTQRSAREGPIWDRHPTLEVAQASFKPYYSVLGAHVHD